MKRIKLYLDDDFKSMLQDWNEVEPFKIKSVADDVDLWNQAIIINGKNYGISSKQGNNYKLYELPSLKLEEKDIWGEDEIKCPICGCEKGDSWENSDDEGEDVCSGCGATLEWTRNVEVTYSATVTKISKPLRL